MSNYTSVTFTWAGEQQPGLWCPTLGPGVIPMEPAEDGWKYSAQLPVATSVSWAIVPNLDEVSPISPALLDAALTTPEPVAPSLFRLIGSDPTLRAEPNIGLLAQPDAPVFDWSLLAEPAPVLPGESLSTGHKVHSSEDPGTRALFLDGEVMQRLHRDFAELGISPTYVHNSGVAQRMGDFADPIGFAQVVGARIETQPEVVVGVSAAALAACALAVELKAPRVVLLSPAMIAGVDAARSLVSSLLDDGVSVDIAVGSEENRPAEGASIFDFAQQLADGLQAAGGQASFTVFPGGHDLAAWRPALAQLLG